MALLTRFGIFGEAQSGSFFGLRPQTLTANIRTHTAQDLGTQDSQRKDTDHDGDKNANDDQHLSSDWQVVDHPVF